MRPVKIVGLLLSLQIFLCQTPSSEALEKSFLSRFSCAKPTPLCQALVRVRLRRRQSETLLLQNGETTTATTATTTTTAATNATAVTGWALEIANATTAMTKFEKLVTALDQNTTNMTTEMAGLVYKQGVNGLHLATAMSMMGKIEVDATANKAFARNLSNLSLTVEVDVRKNARELRQLQKQYMAENGNYKMLSAAGGGLSDAVVKLERAVNATMPGRLTIGARLNKTEAEIKLFNDTLKLGVGSKVSLELKNMLDGVSKEVRNITAELVKKRRATE